MLTSWYPAKSRAFRIAPTRPSIMSLGLTTSAPACACIQINYVKPRQKGTPPKVPWLLWVRFCMENTSNCHGNISFLPKSEPKHERNVSVLSLPSILNNNWDILRMTLSKMKMKSQCTCATACLHSWWTVSSFMITPVKKYFGNEHEVSLKNM